MTTLSRIVSLVVSAIFLTGLGKSDCFAAEPRLELRPNDRIALVGNSLAERMRLYGNFEALLHLAFPEHKLVVRNFGWPCDEVGVQQRPNNYTAIDDPLAVFAPDVLMCFFGFNESFAGAAGLPKFKEDLAAYIQRTKEQFAKDGRPPRLVLVSPIPYEATGNPLLPDGSKENENLKLYADAMREVASAHQLPFADLLNGWKVESNQPYTINGVHQNAYGDAVIAQRLWAELFGTPYPLPENAASRQQFDALQAAVVDLQWHHHQDYRMVNGWYVYGSRSKANDQNTFAAEYAKIRKMCADRDEVVWAIAQGKEPPVPDDANPVLVTPPTKFGTRKHAEPDELRILSPAEAEAAMTVAPGYRVQTFASEADFPELSNPVQMAFDNRGRLWVSCMPCYPQWKPGDPKPNDKLLILEDTDGDGKADKSTVFADGLHIPVGFELWNGGVLAVSQPKLLFLKDTDGDDVADVREVIFDGFASCDTHHAISAFEWTPDGRLVMLEGIAMSTAVETPWGPLRNKDRSVAYALDPRRLQLEPFITPCMSNPWCYSHDDWGQGFVGGGSCAAQHWATPQNGAQFDQRSSNPQIVDYQPVMRPALGNGFLFSRHFPEEAQGNLYFACVINLNGILQFKMSDDGSGYRGERIENLVSSSDKNFRPGDPQIGPDGALYFIDWHNPIIGHAQYSQRDPNRDHKHGRVYRLYAEGRPLVTPVTQADKSVPELLEQLREYEPATRYRVQRELRDRPKEDVVAAVKEWTAAIPANDPLRDRLLTEAMWALAGHFVADEQLLDAVLRAETPDARAAAVHLIADLREFIPNAQQLVAPLIADPHPRVRLEVVRAMSFFPSAESVQIALRALSMPMDAELDYTLESTLGALQPIWVAALKQGEDLTEGNLAVNRYFERVASQGDRGKAANLLLKSLVDNYDNLDHRKRIVSRLNALMASATSGEKVFMRTCKGCHRVGDSGADFGPNLSDVGKRLKKEEILESVIFPNLKIDPNYRATNILTVDGSAMSGLVIAETDTELSLLLGEGKLQKIQLDEVEQRQEVEVSSMPERLHEGMSGAEFLDLLAYLASQRTSPEPMPNAGGN